jgi:hypothetical protein
MSQPDGDGDHSDHDSDEVLVIHQGDAVDDVDSADDDASDDATTTLGADDVGAVSSDEEDFTFDLFAAHDIDFSPMSD